MHNDYTVNKCILNKRMKLKLLQYAETDITFIADELHQISNNLMNDFYNHVVEANKIIQKKVKKHKKIEPFINEQLKDMEFNQTKFSEYFSKDGKKTKEDLYIYLYANQISDNYFNEYLYQTIVKFLKTEYKNDFWEYHNLKQYEVNTFGLYDLYIMRDSKHEMSVGKIDVNIDKSVGVINRYLSNISNDREKLDKLKNIINVLDNYYDKRFAIPMLFAPYKDATTELVNNIIVAKSMDKSTQKIKRL